MEGSAGGGRARPASPQCCRDAWDGPVRSSQKVKNERRGPCGAASRPLPGCTATALGRAGVSPRVGAPVRVTPPARPRGFVTPYLTPRSPAGVGSAALTARPAPCSSLQGVSAGPGDTRGTPVPSSPAPSAQHSTAPPRAAERPLAAVLEDRANRCVKQVTVKRTHKNWEGNPNFFSCFGLLQFHPIHSCYPVLP